MNYQRPELRNMLAAEYVLGTLKGGARRRFEGLLHHDRELLVLVETWTGRLLPAGLPSEEVGPSHRVWFELNQRLDDSTSTVRDKPSRLRWFHRLWPSGFSGASLTAAVGGIAIGVAGMLLIAPGVRVEDLTLRSGDGRSAMQPTASTEGQLPDSYIVVMPDRTGTPALLAAALRSGKVLRVKVLQEFEIAPEDIPVLWALPHGGPPTVLGSLPTEGVAEFDLLAVSEQALATVDELAVSIESRSARPFSAPQAGYVMRSSLIRSW